MIMVVSKLEHDNTATMYSTTYVIQGHSTFTPQLLDINCDAFASKVKWQRIAIL
jgi:hypothetical protein